MVAAHFEGYFEGYHAAHRTEDENGPMSSDIEPFGGKTMSRLRLRHFLFVLDLGNVEPGNHGAELF